MNKLHLAYLLTFWRTYPSDRYNLKSLPVLDLGSSWRTQRLFDGRVSCISSTAGADNRWVKSRYLYEKYGKSGSGLYSQLH